MELRNRKKKKQADWNPEKMELTIRDRGIETTYHLTGQGAVLIREEVIQKK